MLMNDPKKKAEIMKKREKNSLLKTTPIKADSSVENNRPLSKKEKKTSVENNRSFIEEKPQVAV